MRYCPATSAVVVLLAVIVMCCSGCYERVVGVRGPNADAYDVYEPSVKTERDSERPYTHRVPTKTVPTKKAPD